MRVLTFYASKFEGAVTTTRVAPDFAAADPLLRLDILKDCIGECERLYEQALVEFRRERPVRPSRVRRRQGKEAQPHG